MSLRVRLAEVDELVGVGRLTLAAYSHDGHIVEDDAYVAHLLDAAARASRAELMVAELEGRVVGTVTFCPEGSPFRERAAAGEGEFRMLAVDPAARRHGAARALVEACLDRSRELGYASVVISSLPVQVQAHDLYRRLGFVRVPELDWSPAGGVQLISFRIEL